MKRLCLLLIAIIMLAGCTNKGTETASTASGKSYKVVASFYPLYIMALNVTKDVPGVTVKNLTPPTTGCLHDYSITPEDLRKLANADVFVVNGAGMESFLDRVASQYPQLKTVKLAEGIPLLPGAEGDNPHVWVSISGAIKEVQNMGASLAELDPIHAEQYRTNTREYVDKLEALRQKMIRELGPFRGSRIITFHEAFPYFAQEFGLEIATVVEREPGNAPTPRELTETIELIKQNKVKALFAEPQYPTISAESIASQTGMKVYMLDPAVSGPDDLNAYITIMENNLQTLKEALH